MPTPLELCAPETSWAALHDMTETLRHGDPTLQGKHGMGHVFCQHRYSLHRICLDHPMLVLVLEGTKGYALEEACPESEAKNTQPACRTATAPALLLLPAHQPLFIENIPASQSSRYLAHCISFGPDMLEKTASYVIHAGNDSNRDTPAAGPQVPAGQVPAGQVPAGQVPAGQTTSPREGASIAPSHVDSQSLLMALTLLLRSALHAENNPADHCRGRLLDVQREQVLLLLAMLGLGPKLLQRQDPLVGAALSLIRQTPQLPWTVDSLAEQLHCSGRTLRRRLQQEGQSLRLLLRRARLHTALGMLQQQGCTVSEAAFSCGYDSPSRFSQRFREHFGLLPSQVLGNGQGASSSH